MATVSFDFDCDMGYGFLPDPNEHKRVGYVTAFAGLGMAEALRADLNVTSPLTRVATPVVGVIAKFDWAGGIGDPLKIDMYLSQENAVQLKALQQKVLTTTKVTALDYIIINYDQETKQWFTQAAPQDPPLPGIVPGGQDPWLNVDLTPVPVKPGIDVNVYKVSVQIAPRANLAYALTFANSSTEPVVKAWGVVTGSLTSRQPPSTVRPNGKSGPQEPGVSLAADRFGCLGRRGQGGQVVLDGLQASAHGVDRQVRGVRILPLPHRRRQLVLVLLPADTPFHAEAGRVASSLRGPLRHDPASLVELGARSHLREPAVSKPPGAAVGGRRLTADPHWDRPLYRQRCQARPGDPVEGPGERHGLFGPQPAQ
jgi:hypothetical protein